MNKLFALFFICIPFEGNAQTYNYDVNGDGKESIEDITALANHLLGKFNKGEHEYVDLGLPSGTLWATCNIGADTPEDYGLYFAWGETTGYTSDISDNYSFDWTNYKLCDGSWSSLTKYCISSNYGTVDNKTELEKEDDAAYVIWGNGWHIPSYKDFLELLRNCEKTDFTRNGVFGYKITGTNGNFIFLPAAGVRADKRFLSAGREGYYWSRTLYNPDSVNYLHFNDDENAMSYNYYIDIVQDSYRCEGYTIRPVRLP